MSFSDIIKISKFDQYVNEGIQEYYNDVDEDIKEKEQLKNNKLLSGADSFTNEDIQTLDSPGFKFVINYIDNLSTDDINLLKKYTQKSYSWYELHNKYDQILVAIEDFILDKEYYNNNNNNINYNYENIENINRHKIISLLYGYDFYDDINEIKKVGEDIIKYFFNRKINIENIIKFKDYNNELIKYFRETDKFNKEDLQNKLNGMVDRDLLYKDTKSFSSALYSLETILDIRQLLDNKNTSLNKITESIKKSIIQFNKGEVTNAILTEDDTQSFLERFMLFAESCEKRESSGLIDLRNALNLYSGRINNLNKNYNNIIYYKINDRNVNYNVDTPATKSKIKTLKQLLESFQSKHLANLINYLNDLDNNIVNNYSLSSQSLDFEITYKANNIFASSLLFCFGISNDFFFYINHNLIDKLNLNFQNNVNISLNDLKNIKQHIIKKFVLQSKLDIKQIHRSKKYNYLKTMLNETNDLVELIYLLYKLDKLFTLTEVIEKENINKNDFNKLCKKGIANLLNFGVQNTRDYDAYRKKTITDQNIDESPDYVKIKNNIKITLTKDIALIDLYKKLSLIIHSFPKYNLLKDISKIDKKMSRLNELQLLRADFSRRELTYEEEKKLNENIKDKETYYTEYKKVIELEKTMEVMQKYNYNKIILDTNIGNSYLTILEGYGIQYIKNNILPILDSKDSTYEGINNIINKQTFLNNLNLLESNIDNINKKPSLLLNNKFNDCITDLLSDINKIKTYKAFKKYYNNMEEKIPELNILNYRIDNKLEFKVLQTGDVAALDTVGKYTDCCQRLGSAGEMAAIDSFINKYASVLVLYYEGRILSQSYFHYITEEQDPGGPGIILDNVEVNEELLKNSKVNLDGVYKLLANYLKQSHSEIKYFRCGLQYNKLNEDKWSKGSSPNDYRVFSDQLEDRYSDYDTYNYLDLFS